MSELHTYNNSHVTTITEYEFTQIAEAGAVGTGSAVIEDSAGTLSIVGQKDWLSTQSSCALTRTFRGFVADRTYTRGTDPKVGASRTITATLEDLNSMLGFRLVNGVIPDVSAEQGGRRPAESIAERGAWLMASSFVSGLFIDNGRCDFPADKGMDKADYRYQHVGDILADMALAAGGYNYHVQDYGSGPELIFRDDNASTADSSTLRISNVLSDVDSDHDTLGANKTFAPSSDVTLTRRPGRVISKLAYAYAKGTKVRELAATATSFNGERSGTASNSNVKSEAKAAEEADSQLFQLSTEEDVIDLTIQVPSSAVNLVMAGYRIQAKFSHLATEGYGSFTWFRVLERSVTSEVPEGTIYNIKLKLSPQESGPPAPAGVGVVQSAFGRGFPGGFSLSFPNPVTIGNVLVAVICTKLASDPAQPAITDDLPHLGGTNAWTRFNGATLSRWISTGGLSAYYKTATATDQTAYTPAQNPLVGIWELSGADPASATIVSKDLATGGSNYDIGTQTPAVGDFAIAAWGLGTPDWFTGPAYAQPHPNPSVSAGWDLEASEWTIDRWARDTFLPQHPWNIIADAEGTGAALLARVTPGDSGHSFGAIYIVIPAA